MPLYPGFIGFTIHDEREPENDRGQHLGVIGSPNSTQGAAGAEVRGKVGISLADNSIDFDYYVGRADWSRPAYDYTPIYADISLNAHVGADQIAGFVYTVFSALDRSIVSSGIDFIIGDNVRQTFGDEFYYMLEDQDDDFVSSFYQEPASTGIHWNYNQIVGIEANTFVIGIGGFVMDLNGNLDAVNYTMNWAFS